MRENPVHISLYHTFNPFATLPRNTPLSVTPFGILSLGVSHNLTESENLTNEESDANQE